MTDAPFKLYYEPEFKFDAKGVESNRVRAELPTHPTAAKRKVQLAGLTESIRSEGVKSPILVSITQPHEHKYVVVAPGQNRCRAQRRLGRDTIPALIVDYTGRYRGTEITNDEAFALFTDDMELRLGNRLVTTVHPYGRRGWMPDAK